MQNLSFLTAGTVGLTGANNNGVINPLGVTLDNVSFATLPSSDFTPAPTNVTLTYGPGQVSSNFVTDFQSFVGANGGNTLTDNRTATSLASTRMQLYFHRAGIDGPHRSAADNRLLVRRQPPSSSLLLRWEAAPILPGPLRSPMEPAARPRLLCQEPATLSPFR